MSNLDPKLLNNITDSQTTFADDDLFIAWNTSGGYNYKIKIPDVVKDAVQDAGAVQSLQADTISNRPAPGNQDAWFISTDEPAFYRDDSTNWVKIYGTVIGYDEGSGGSQVPTNDARDARNNTFSGNNTFTSNNSIINGSILKIDGNGGALEVVDGSSSTDVTAFQVKSNQLIANTEVETRTINAGSFSAYLRLLGSGTNNETRIQGDSLTNLAVFNDNIIELHKNVNFPKTAVDIALSGTNRLGIFPNSFTVKGQPLILDGINLQLPTSNHIVNDSSNQVLSSDTTGAPSLPNTIIWFYTLSASHSLSNGWNTVPFDGSDDTQELNAPEPNASGEFVAPISGYYQVSGTIYFESTSSSDGAAVYEWAININGTRRTLGKSETREINGNQVMGHFSTGISQIVYLTSGQTLAMEGYQRSEQNIHVETTTNFGGHLITAG